MCMVLWEGGCVVLFGGCVTGGACMTGACMTGGVHGMHAPPPVNRITDRCKNITFAQTTFAGGNKWLFLP